MPGSGRGARGQQPLVSEAVRGEGAFLVDDAGAGSCTASTSWPTSRRATWWPRRSCGACARPAPTTSGWTRAHFGAEKWRVRFPTIYATLLRLGIDPAHELIPVVPACHYASGGVRTDLLRRVALPGLYVCGESACTGVHGANRLASNSLLEGLVFGRRIADAIVARLVAPRPLPTRCRRSGRPDPCSTAGSARPCSS